jgi:hypothetical protein
MRVDTDGVLGRHNIQEGGVKLTVVNESGKEAVVAILGRGLCQEDEKSSCCTKDEGGPFEAAL